MSLSCPKSLDSSLVNRYPGWATLEPGVSASSPDRDSFVDLPSLEHLFACSDSWTVCLTGKGQVHP